MLFTICAKPQLLKGNLGVTAAEALTNLQVCTQESSFVPQDFSRHISVLTAFGFFPPILINRMLCDTTYHTVDPQYLKNR